MLAEKLHMSVRRAMTEIDSREFAEWCAYWTVKEQKMEGTAVGDKEIGNLFLSLPSIDNRKNK